MKNMFLALGALFVFGTLVWAVDYPYVCSQTENCDEECTDAAVFCTISGTVQFETTCSYQIDPGKSIRCIAYKKNTQIIVGDSNVKSCKGCDSGGIGGGCEPGSGAWWIGCDPFAY